MPSLCIRIESATRTTSTISRTPCTRTTWAPNNTLAATAPAVPHSLSSGGTSPSTAVKKDFLEGPTRIGRPSKRNRSSWPSQQAVSRGVGSRRGQQSPRAQGEGGEQQVVELHAVLPGTWQAIGLAGTRAATILRTRITFWGTNPASAGDQGAAKTERSKWLRIS